MVKMNEPYDICEISNNISEVVIARLENEFDFASNNAHKDCIHKFARDIVDTFVAKYKSDDSCIGCDETINFLTQALVLERTLRKFDIKN